MTPARENEALDELGAVANLVSYHDHVLAVARAALAGGGAVPLRFPVGQPAVLSAPDAAALVDFSRAVVDGVLALSGPGRDEAQRRAEFYHEAQGKRPIVAEAST